MFTETAGFKDIATIDGPPASGKTTMAGLLAMEFGLTHLDSGSIFRTVTYHCMKHDVNLKDSEAVVKELHRINLKLTGEKVFLAGEDVSEIIRTPSVTNNVCFISNLPEVRKFVKDVQLAHAENGKVVCDGRKVGREVFPNSAVKFYLTADQRTRAYRRYLQFKAKDPSVTFEEVYSDIKAREEKERSNGILLMPENAIVIDNTHLSIEETLSVMEVYLMEKA